MTDSGRVWKFDTIINQWRRNLRRHLSVLFCHQRRNHLGTTGYQDHVEARRHSE